MGLSDKIALVDLDSTLVDYEGGLRSAMEPLYGPDEPRFEMHEDAPPYIEARRNLIKKQPGFWRNLNRISLGFDVLDDLRDRDFELHILTKGPTKTTSAWSEKLEWVQNHVPDAQMTITQEKSLVYGRVLVDDYPPYFLKWLEVRPRGLVIGVAQPWNKDIEHPNFIRYDGTNRSQIQRALDVAKMRNAGEALAFNQ